MMFMSKFVEYVVCAGNSQSCMLQFVVCHLTDFVIHLTTKL